MRTIRPSGPSGAFSEWPRGWGPAALMKSEGSKPSRALSAERRGWGPAAVIEERGEQ